MESADLPGFHLVRLAFHWHYLTGVFVVAMASRHDEGNHTCNICRRSFRSRGSLYDHKLTHEEKSYECREKGCRKSYSTRQGLNHHLRNSHNTSGTSSRTRPREEPKLYYASQDKENRAPDTVRRQDERRKRRSPPPPNDHLLDETPPRKTPRDRSPVRAPLPSPDPPTPKLVIHAEEKLTDSESDTSGSSNNSSPASSRAASPTKMITRFTQTDTLVSLCGQMCRLRLMYEPVASNNKH